jgi:hypothetical protein
MGQIVPTIRGVSMSMTRMAAAFAIALATAAPAGAADLWYPASFSPPADTDWSFKAFDPPKIYTGEFGTRLWYGRARTAKDLFDNTGALLLSRLTYSDMHVFSGEAFTRFDLDTGWFLKGYAGGGWLLGGELKDEDVPPITDPYSATLSEQRRGYLAYGSVDAGFKIVRGPDFHVGAFVGYSFMRDHMIAFGCGQIASNAAICGLPGIPDFVRVISQQNDWHSLRVGVEAAVEFDRRWTLAVDAAWLPYSRLRGWDAHWLRIGSDTGDFTGKVPEDGKGSGVQIDGFLSYRYNDLFSVGLGGRYWRVDSNGFTHFENHIVGGGGLPQVLKWKAEHFGVFLQSSVKFGPARLAGGI